jgi:hypothetical protein
MEYIQIYRKRSIYPDIQGNTICNLHKHICTFAAPSSDSNIALDLRSGCAIGGLISCMCWIQYATPMIILILPFQSTGSNPSTAKCKQILLVLPYKGKLYAKLNSIDNSYHGDVRIVFHWVHILTPSPS